MTLVALGPLPCMYCRKTVTWVRTDGHWVLLEGKTRHVCAARKTA